MVLRTIGIFSILVAIAATFSMATDSDRIDLLEKEIRDLKIRVSKLEEPAENKGVKPDAPSSGEGWMSISNWRKLETGMHPNTVRRILGEPQRVNGGTVASWYYPNGGQVTFISEKAYSWQEPDE